MDRTIAILKVDGGLERRHERAGPQLILREPALCEGDSRAGAGQVDCQTRDIRRVTELTAYRPRGAGGLEPGCPSGVSCESRSPAYVDQIFLAKRGRITPEKLALGGELG